MENASGAWYNGIKVKARIREKVFRGNIMATKEYFKRHYSPYFLEPYAVKLTNGELHVGDVDDTVIYEAELYIDETLEKNGESRCYVIDDNTYYGHVPNIFAERQFGQKQVTFIMGLFYTSIAAALFIAFIAYNSGQTDYIQAFFGGVLIAAMAAFLTAIFLTKFTYEPRPNEFTHSQVEGVAKEQEATPDDDYIDPDVEAFLFPKEEYVILEEFPENIEDYIEQDEAPEQGFQEVPESTNNTSNVENADRDGEAILSEEEQAKDSLYNYIQVTRSIVTSGLNPEVSEDDLKHYENLFQEKYGITVDEYDRNKH